MVGETLAVSRRHHDTWSISWY